MRRKAAGILLCSVLSCISLSGCSVQVGANDATGSASVASNNDDLGIAEIIQVGKFSEGRAAVSFVPASDESASCIGYINNEGRLLFKADIDSECGVSAATPGGLLQAGEFSDGIAFLYDLTDGEDDREYICISIDANGKRLHTFDGAVAHGDGFVVEEHLKEGFDNSAYEYTVLDAKGNEIISISRNAEDFWYDVSYCGNGIFEFNSTLDDSLSNDGVTLFYDAPNRKELIVSAESNSKVSFDEEGEWAVLRCDREFDTVKVTMMNRNGSLKSLEFNCPLGTSSPDRERALVGEGICLIQHDGGLISYDMSTGEKHELEQKYADRLVWADSYSDGLCMLTFNGTDGNAYLGLFDESLQCVCEPFKVDGHTMAPYADSMIICGDMSEDQGFYADIYNSEGELVFQTANELTWNSGIKNGFSEGILLINEGASATAYDIDGDIVFDNIVA